MLPNLEELALSDSWYEDVIEPEASYNQDEISETQRSISKLLRLLVSRANDHTLEDQPLGKLRVLQPTASMGSQFGIDLINFTPFLALKLLREAHIFDGTYDVGGDEEGGYCSERYSLMGEQSEMLKLNECNMSAEGASLFFKSMKSLKHLDLSYSMQDEVGFGWEIDAFVQSLSKAVGSTLQTLTLKAGYGFEDLTPDERLGSSMSGSKILLHLTLDCQLVQGESEECFGDDESPPQLVETLPSSLYSLALITSGSERIVRFLETLLSEFDGKRRERLPKLEKAKLTMAVQLSPSETADSTPYVIQSRKIIEKAGIELEIAEQHIERRDSFEVVVVSGRDDGYDEDLGDGDEQGDDDNAEEDDETE